MALAISGIPMLTGDEALAFREKAEETLKKRGSIDFSKQRAEMKAILAKAKFLSPVSTTCLVNLTEKEQSLKSENGNLAESHTNGYFPA